MHSVFSFVVSMLVILLDRIRDRSLTWVYQGGRFVADNGTKTGPCNGVKLAGSRQIYYYFFCNNTQTTGLMRSDIVALG
jgi:hypothetical protein